MILTSKNLIKKKKKRHGKGESCKNTVNKNFLILITDNDLAK